MDDNLSTVWFSATAFSFSASPSAPAGLGGTTAVAKISAPLRL